MSYTVEQVETEVRALLGEEDTSGYYSTTYFLKQLNICIKSRIIPDLFAVSKYRMLYDLVTTAELKNLDVDDDRYDFYDFNALVAYEPSVRAWIDKVRVEILDIDKVFEYEDDDYAYFRPQVLGAIIGNEIRIYGVDAYKWQRFSYDSLSGSFTVDETITGGTSEATGVIVSDVGLVLTLKDVSGIFVDGEEITGENSSATADVDGDPVNAALDLEYIEVPTYAAEATVELPDHVIEAFLIPIMCYEALRREPEFPKNKAEAFKLDYIEALKVVAGTYQNTVGPEPLPIERIGKALGG